MFTESSGRPYSYDIFGGSYLSGGRESINGSGGPVYLPTVGRDTLRLSDTANVDLRVSRGVRVGERVLVRGVAEMFNVTNRVNDSGLMERHFWWMGWVGLLRWCFRMLLRWRRRG